MTSTSDQTYTIETINPRTTPGVAASSDVVAILPLSDTTVTAYQVTGTTGVAVVDGITLSFRQQGFNLSDGEIVSLGFYGLEDSTTTALYKTETSLFGSTAATIFPAQALKLLRSADQCCSDVRDQHIGCSEHVIADSDFRLYEDIWWQQRSSDEL